MKNKIIVFVFLLSIFISCFAFVGCSKVDKSVAVDEEGNELISGKIYDMPSILSFTSAGNGVSVTLTATVLPEDAANKQVDWSISWGNAPTYGSNDVTDYVDVVAQSEGSNVATITCYQAFGDDIINVVVTTRDGGYTAVCTVRFYGAPTSINYSTNKSLVGGNALVNSYYEISTTEEADFSILLDNQYHSIGSSFVPSYSISVTPVNDIYFVCELYADDGSLFDTQYGQKGSFEAYSDDDYDYVMFAQFKVGQFEYEKDIFGCKIVNNHLYISGLNTFSSMDSGPGAIRTYHDSRYAFMYFDLTLIENNTGLSIHIYFKVVAGVTSVSLDKLTANM